MKTQHTSNARFTVDRITMRVSTVIASLESVSSSFPLVFTCILILLCSCLCTWIVNVTSQGKNSQGIGLLVFVLSLILGTLVVRSGVPPPPILLFCMHICCLAYVWITSSVVVSLFVS